MHVVIAKIQAIVWTGNCHWLLRLVVAMTFLWVSQTAAAASPDSLLHTPYPQRCELITNVYQTAWKSDSNQALKLAGELRHFFARKGNETDQLIFEVSILLPVDSTVPFRKEEFLNKVLPLLSEAERQDNLLAKAKLNELLGFFYYNHLHQYFLAFYHYSQAYHMVLNLDETAYPDRAYTIYRLGRVNYDFFDYENAIRYGQVLMKEQITETLPSHIFNACMLGMAYLKLNRCQQARMHFEWALRRLPVKRLYNEAWVGILNGNIGLTYYEQKDYAKAIPYLQRGAELSEKTALWDNVPRFTAKLALIHLERKQFNLAKQFALQTLDAAHKNDSLVYPMAQFVTEPYQVMAAYHRATGNYEQAMYYADLAAASSTRWKQQIDVTLKHKAEMALEEERYKAKEQRLQQEKQQQLLLRNFLLILTILALLVVLLLYNRRQLKDRHRRQQLQAEKQLAEAELQSAKALLDQLRQGVQQKSRLIDQYEAEFSVSADGPAIGSNQYQLLNDLRHSVILTDDDWHQFVDVFEKVHPDFFYRLKAQLPDLTPSETRFMALSRLGYTVREMADMLGVSQGAIRQYRHTIRRKLALGEEVSVEEIARRI
ncbi:hypothetical protein GCM10023187_14810 [Nibrella viscosa]|uniref:HTH luxR-type domain-containing protein n=1 Tax=Nibrella viscosa TaxID=1084524 RepID=A0ABP8K5R5_9BACT